MARRRESAFDLLASLPWPAGITLAAIVWVAAPVAAARVARISPFLLALQPVLLMILRLFAGVCAAAAVAALVRARGLSRRLRAQHSLEDLRSLSWQQFEQVVGEAFRQRGYAVLETGLGGADGGVDLVLTDGEGRQFLVQCKQYRASQVGVTVVREILGVVAARGAAGGRVVTTGHFTKDAVEFARGQAIELIDGAQLEAMVRAINGLGGASTTPTAHAKATGAGEPPTCPRCARPMVLRIARNTRKRFYGCSTYPNCRGTRPGA